MCVRNDQLHVTGWTMFPGFSGAKKEDSLYIRISEIKKTNCKCKSCNFLKTYVDFIDDDHERT